MTIKPRIGIDIGGTFTDAIVISKDGILAAKVPSNPQNPSAAVLAALDALKLKETPGQFLHGTTLVTNMLLERKGALTGFITSSGMRDVLHIGRHERPLTYAIKQEIPQQEYPPAPRKWRISVPERVDADGEVIIPLEEKSIRKATQMLVAAGVEAIAVGFLHSYRFPTHELQAEQWIKAEAPDIFVCTSHEVSPRFREYERFLTTAWNARVAPGAGQYLEKLAREIDTRWSGLRLMLMSSNGGLEEVDMLEKEIYGDLRRTPIRLGLSGPAAAGNAVARVASDLGLTHCVGLDVGGTSSDIVVIRDRRLGEAPWEERRVGGYPLQIPMLDLHTIGAGGGSIVSRDEYGAIHVGPQSAGAEPGPACYARGGVHPTVTDAAVATGRLPKNILLGGMMPVQVNLAEKAIANTFKVDGNGIIKASLDVLAMAEANIAFGIRERTVARGLDPAELALVAAGGAGPLLACGVANALELAEVIVPPRPGLLAAWGLLVAPDRRESAVTILQPLQEVTSVQSVAYFQQAYDGLSAPPPENAQVLRTAAMRYLGQGFEVEINVDDPADISELKKRFHDAHEHEYRFSMPDSPVEWVELRVAWEIKAQEWAFQKTAGKVDTEKMAGSLWEYRPDGKKNGERHPARTQARLLLRDTLTLGTALDGPAIILENDATTYIPTGWKGQVTKGGYLRIRNHER